MRIDCDINKCSGCLACVVTCTDHHFGKDDKNALPGRIYTKISLPSGVTQYVTESCRHCDDAPCAAACPVGAISSNEDGWVVVDRNICIGCQACLSACPFNIPRFAEDGTMVKCDGCGGNPACVTNCPNGALSISF